MSIKEEQQRQITNMNKFNGNRGRTTNMNKSKQI